MPTMHDEMTMIEVDINGIIDLAQVTVAVSSCCQSESTRISQEEAVASTQEFWSSFTTWSKLILAKQHFDHLVKVALWT